MDRILRSRQVMWVVGPVQTTVVRERVLYITFGAQPTRVSPYYTHALFHVDMMVKRPPPKEILDEVAMLVSVDGIRWTRRAGPSNQWIWRTNTDLATRESLSRAASMQFVGSLGPAARGRTGFFPEYWMLEYSATSTGLIPTMTFIISATFSGSTPYGVE